MIYYAIEILKQAKHIDLSMINEYANRAVYILYENGKMEEAIIDPSGQKLILQNRIESISTEKIIIPKPLVYYMTFNKIELERITRDEIITSFSCEKYIIYRVKSDGENCRKEEGIFSKNGNDTVLKSTYSELTINVNEIDLKYRAYRIKRAHKSNRTSFFED